MDRRYDDGPVGRKRHNPVHFAWTTRRALWSTRESTRRCETASMTSSDLPKIGAPATRALASIGITRLAQVAERSEAELLALHGFGPRALRILREALSDQGLSLRP